MQSGCHPSNIPHISTEAEEEHSVPAEEENRQHDRKMEEEKKQEGQSEEGTTGEGLPQHGHPTGLIILVKGRIFQLFYRCGTKLET